MVLELLRRPAAGCCEGAPAPDAHRHEGAEPPLAPPCERDRMSCGVCAAACA
eukprot:CAMPEP_0119371692 /NCGR_PEP_ID=MMETSP1334-20130426/17807_1 /TAXON_ID=127549 /ORGANISM="Calcidiscus leptoporus, Strain RCC1130" /LENGTH=51 /DNA_ID=CAMNT_0007389013 /DNA_START=36 /DNA_END=188 /DNA_ORIENTATION=-